MNNSSPPLNKIKDLGYRITKSRQAIVSLLLKSDAHLSASEILKQLSARNIILNKTTVYRELYFLRDLGIIDELGYNDKHKLYEIAKEHHHHIVCQKCGRTEEFDCASEVNLIISKLKSKEFELSSHSLEFFGLCPKCK